MLTKTDHTERVAALERHHLTTALLETDRPIEVQHVTLKPIEVLHQEQAPQAEVPTMATPIEVLQEATKATEALRQGLAHILREEVQEAVTVLAEAQEEQFVLRAAELRDRVRPVAVEETKSFNH